MEIAKHQIAGTKNATTTTEVMDQGANVSGAVDATATDVATTSDAVVN
jgi:hypothetical protein